MNRVYILNRAAHDYSRAERFGVLTPLTDGMLNKLATNQMYRHMEAGMRDSSPDDYIILSSLTTLCVIGCCYFAALHGKLNLLIFQNGDYVLRTMLFPTVKEFTNALDNAYDH